MHDEETLAFYALEADSYAARYGAAVSPDLHSFLSNLQPGARILELGCGSGSNAAAMLRLGFDVDVTDGSPEMACQAAALLGQPVRVLLFEDLNSVEAYDAVWASACLLHVPTAGLSTVLSRIHCALRPGGYFYASYKAGGGGGRDALGRYYNYPTQHELAKAYAAAGKWAEVDVAQQEGGGYDNLPTNWLAVTAQRAL